MSPLFNCSQCIIHPSYLSLYYSINDLQRFVSLMPPIARAVQGQEGAA